MEFSPPPTNETTRRRKGDTEQEKQSNDLKDLETITTKSTIEMFHRKDPIRGAASEPIVKKENNEPLTIITDESLGILSSESDSENDIELLDSRPTHTLIVSNVRSLSFNDFEKIFAPFGQIKTFHLDTIELDFMMITYFDIRDSIFAFRSLQGFLYKGTVLNIKFSLPVIYHDDLNQGSLVVFNLPEGVSNNQVLELFSRFGEVKDIRETPNKTTHKFVEYFDLRHAETAKTFLDRTIVNGKNLKIEFSHPGGFRKGQADMLKRKHIRKHKSNDSKALLPLGDALPISSNLTNDKFAQQLSNASLSSSSDSLSLKLQSSFSSSRSQQSVRTESSSALQSSSVNSNGHLQRRDSVVSEGKFSEYHQGKPFHPAFSDATLFNSLRVQTTPRSFKNFSRNRSRFSNKERSSASLPNSRNNTSFQFVSNPSFHSMAQSSNQKLEFNLHTDPPIFDVDAVEFKPKKRLFGSERSFTSLESLEIHPNQLHNDPRTTIMIRNIPNKYTQKMLLKLIDIYHKNQYNFFYLPMDLKTKCNFGYAFVNLLNTDHVKSFYQHFNGTKWQKFSSEKVCTLSYARIQGLKEILAHSLGSNHSAKSVLPFVLLDGEYCTLPSFSVSVMRVDEIEMLTGNSNVNKCV